MKTRSFIRAGGFALLFLGQSSAWSQHKTAEMTQADAALATALGNQHDTNPGRLCAKLSQMKFEYQQRFDCVEDRRCDASSIKPTDKPNLEYAKRLMQRCEKELAQRRDKRMDMLPMTSPKDLAEIPEIYRLPEEQEKVLPWQKEMEEKQRQDQKRKDEQLAAWRTSEEVMAPVLSMELCDLVGTQKEYRREMAQLGRHSRGAATANPKIESDKTRIASLDDQKKEIQAEMKKLKFKALDCGSRTVATLRQCSMDDGQAACKADSMKATLAAYQDFQQRQHAIKKDDSAKSAAPEDEKIGVASATKIEGWKELKLGTNLAALRGQFPSLEELRRLPFPDPTPNPNIKTYKVAASGDTKSYIVRLHRDRLYYISVAFDYSKLGVDNAVAMVDRLKPDLGAPKAASKLDEAPIKSQSEFNWRSDAVEAKLSFTPQEAGHAGEAVLRLVSSEIENEILKENAERALQ